MSVRNHFIGLCNHFIGLRNYFMSEGFIAELKIAALAAHRNPDYGV
jgi:hypothetical protein